MRTLAFTFAVGMSLISSAAFAADQRPTYMAFSAPKATVAAANVAPAAPSVAKGDESFGTIPLYIPLLGIVAIAGFIAAISGGGNGNNGSPG